MEEGHRGAQALPDPVQDAPGAPAAIPRVRAPGEEEEGEGGEDQAGADQDH